MLVPDNTFTFTYMYAAATIPQNRDGADDSGGVTKRKSQHVHSTPEAKRQRSGEESRGVTKRKSPDAKSSGGTKRQSTDLGSKDSKFTSFTNKNSNIDMRKIVTI